MRILLTSWAWATHMYHMVPLGWAFCAAGHEVRVASQPALVEAIRSTGLTAVAVGEDVDFLSARARDRVQPVDQLPPPGSVPDYRRMWRNTTTRITDLADAMAPDLTDFCRAWRPDLVVWDWMTFGGPIAARLTGVPSARFLYGPDLLTRLGRAAEEADPGGRDRWLSDLYGRFGAEPGGAGAEWGGTALLDTCPPSAQLPGVDGLRMRYIPYNGPAEAPRWTVEPPRRPRVCVTMGLLTRNLRNQDSVLLPELLRELSGADAEVVVAGTPAQRAELTDLPANARFAELVPLHALLGGCSAIVHQGGAGTAMSAAYYGVPQVVAAAIADQPFNAERFARTGAVVPVPAVAGSEGAVRAAVDEVLTKPQYPAAARALRDEVMAQPSPAAAVEALREAVR
ncbi:UDP:flavonoid glycosyltransferase YjiC (YdhE family) [Saccharothrix coeruleofusca]|uniref:nucleotide disphospho-sugar-binding domain-containing protein n=1 Tax=Saccharothrix coeruleofusca TaxID=33919 RepID=UPI001AE34286|nr:nucleotide disphospho-sugar-binding domain-containing protein [Saccharothrix coeruleofusca]MBP2336620.1 UDP:flavonoid glycosyltransferase YjiC (YdhE family) [Saccharothrix coeruleofusca]